MKIARFEKDLLNTHFAGFMDLFIKQGANII